MKRLSRLNLWSLLTIITFLMVTAVATAAALPAITPQGKVEGSWEIATQLGEFSYQTRLEQTTRPLPSLANAGLGTTTEQIYIEGTNNLSNDTLSMRIWADGQSPLNEQNGLEIKVENGRTLGRVGSGEWEEVDDISQLVAPGRDNLGFLAAATNVALTESESRSGIAFDRYTFELDGPAFASYMREQMEAELAQRSALPRGVHLNMSDQFVDMVGTGELWVDRRGLPLRLTTDMVLPADNQEQTSVQITTDFSDWDQSLSAQAATWHGRLQLNGADMVRQGGVVFASVAGTLFLFVATFMVLQAIGWRRAYGSVIGLMVGTMVLQPLLEPLAAHAENGRFQQFQAQQQRLQPEQPAAQPEFAAAQEAAPPSFDSYQNPLAAGPDLNASAPLHTPLSNSIQITNTITITDTDGDLLPDDLEDVLGTDPADPDSDDDGLDDGLEVYSDAFSNPMLDDSDGDGLSDRDELLVLGTNPNDIDTDGDFISDKTEVQGFLDGNNQRRYSNPLSSDTNIDARFDNIECPALVDVALAENNLTAVFNGNTPGPDVICSDIDGDGEPDLLDRDDDGDGVPDEVDSDPTTAVTGGQSNDLGCPNDYNCLVGITGNNYAFTLSDYNANLPLFADFQIRPENPEHLQYMMHVLDWPDNDKEGQIRTGAGNTFGNSGNAAHGDLRLYPVLELSIPSMGFTYPTLPKLNNAPAPITTTTPLSAWLDTTLLDQFSIVMRQKDAVSGDLLAYVPLSIVNDPISGDPVAFAGRMTYLPDSLTWGNDHAARLVWMVEVINGSGVAEFIHVYEDEWILTGMTVREEHGINVALAYEDPVFAQAQADYDPATYTEQNIWQLAGGLSETFIAGRTNALNQRDITVAEIANRWDKNSNAGNGLTDGNAELWDIPKEALFVDTISLNHQGELGKIPGEINNVLTRTFSPIAAQGVITASVISVAREEQVRLASLDAQGVQTTATGTISLADATVDTFVASQLSAYQYADASWAPFDPDLYWATYFRDRVQHDLDESFFAYLGDEADPESRVGFYAYAYVFFKSHFVGLHTLVQRGLTVTESLSFLTDEEIATFIISATGLSGKFARTTVRAVNFAASWYLLTPSLPWQGRLLSNANDLRFIINQLKVTSAEDLQRLAARVNFGTAADALEQYNALNSWKRLVINEKFVKNHLQKISKNFVTSGDGLSFLLNSYYTTSVDKRMVPLGYNVLEGTTVDDILAGGGLREVYSKSQNVIKSKFNWLKLIGVGLAGGAIITGITFLGRKLGDNKLEATIISAQALNIVYQSLTVFQSSRYIYGVTKGITDLKGFAKYSKVVNLITDNVSKMTKITAVIGTVVEVFVAVGLFIVVSFATGLDLTSQLGIRSFIELLGTVTVSIIMFGISLIPIIGQILIAIVYIVDAILSIICLAGDDARPRSFICQGLSGALSIAIGAVFYGFQTIVDPTRDDLITTGAPNITLHDPEKGFTVGNQFDLELPITTTLYKKKPNSLGSSFRPGFFTGLDKAKESVFEYSIVNTPFHSNSVSLGDQTYSWVALPENKKKNEPDLQGDTIARGVATLSTPGANTLVTNAYLSLGYAIPALECVTVGCSEYVEEDTYTIPLAGFAFDVLPVTFDEFLALTPVGNSGGYSFAWGQNSGLLFPQFMDADGDGLVVGIDPNDGRADNDGDRLSDFYEVQNNLDPNNPDTDGDGLTDYEDLFYGTNPTLADSDNDGLQDDEEIFGWTIGYGYGLTTIVRSDPLVADYDEDGYIDSVEEAYGFNPYIPDNGDILQVDTQFEEWVDVPATQPCTTLTLDTLFVEDAVRDDTEPLEFDTAELAVLINGRFVWSAEGVSDNQTLNINETFSYCNGSALVEVIELDQGRWSDDLVGDSLLIEATDPSASVVLESNAQGSKVTLSYSMSAYNSDTVPLLLPSDGYVAAGQDVEIVTTVENALTARNALGLVTVDVPPTWPSSGVNKRPFILPPTESETIVGLTTVPNSINTTGQYDVTSTAGALFDPSLNPTSSVTQFYTPTVHITFDNDDRVGSTFYNVAPDSTATVGNIGSRNPTPNADGALDQSAYFTRIGSGNLVDKGDVLHVTDPNGDLALNGGSFTLSSWLNRPEINTRGAIAGFMPSVDQSHLAYPTLYADGPNIGLYFGDGTTACSVITNDAPLTVNTWQHIAATFDASTGLVTIYLNATPIKTQTCSERPTQQSQFWIGRATRADQIYFDKLYVKKNGSGVPIRMTLTAFNERLFDDKVRDRRDYDIQETVTFNYDGCSVGYLSTGCGFILRRFGSGNQGYNDADLMNGTVENSYVVAGTNPATADDYPTVNELKTGSYELDFKSGVYGDCDLYGCGTLHFTHRNKSMHFFQASLDDFRLYKEALPEAGIRDIVNSAETALELPLDEQPGAYTQYDYSGLRNDGYCQGTECPNAGQPGRDSRAILFDGQNDVVVLDTIDQLRLNRNDWMVAGWANPTSSNGYLLSSGTATPELVFRLDQGEPTLDVAGTTIQAPAAIPLNQWSHLAIVREGDLFTIYVDGTAVQSGTVVTTFSDTQAYLGGHPLVNNAAFTGRLDQWLIRTGLFVQADVQNVINSAPLVRVPFDEAASSQTFQDIASGASYSCANSNSCPLADQDGQEYGAVRFDGNDSLSLNGAQPPLNQDWTTTLWVNMDGLTTNSQGLVYDDASKDLIDLSITATGQISYDVCGNGSAATSVNKLLPSTWNQIAVVYNHDAQTAVLYLNGSLDSSVTTTTGCTSSSSTGLTLGMGGDGFTGQLDELALYGAALSSQQLRDIFTYQIAWYDVVDTATLIVDVDAPTAEVATDGVISAVDPVIIISATDQNQPNALNSGVALVEYKVDSEPDWHEAVRDGEVWAFILDTSQKGSGNYSIEVRATDAVGNVSSISQASVTVDADGPTLNLNSTSAVGETAVQLDGTAVDSGGVSDVRVEILDHDGQTIAGQQPADLSGSGNSISWTAVYTSSLPLYGSYDTNLFAVDTLGNVTTETHTIDIDLTAATTFLTDIGDTEGVLAGIDADLPVISGYAADIPFLPNESVSLQFEEAGAPFLDGSPNRNHANCANCPATEAGQLGQAVSFDGVDELLTISNANGSFDDNLDIEGNITFATWVKPASLSGEQVILARGADADNQVVLRLKDGQYQAGVIENGTGHLASATIPTADLNQWVHLAGIYNGAEWLLYRNGNIVNRIDGNGSFLTGDNWVVGGAPFGGSFFNGALDSLFLYDKQVPQSTIQAMANPVASATVATVEVGLLHLKDIADPAQTTWYPAMLDSTSSLFTGWSLQIPAGIEGPYRLSLRTTDGDGRIRLEENVWDGEIDTQAPTAVLSFWDEIPNRGAFFACDVSDYNLTIEGIDCSVIRRDRRLNIRDYQDAQWFTDLFSPALKLERAATSGGIWRKTTNRTYDLTACDLYGNCTTVSPTAGIAPVALVQSNNAESASLGAPTAATTVVRIEEPVSGDAVTDLSASIPISGFIQADDFPVTLEVQANGVVIYSETFASSATGEETWSTSWTPSTADEYAITASIVDNLGNSANHIDNTVGATIPPVMLYASDQAPTVTIDGSVAIISSVDFLPNGTILVSGQVTDLVGIDMVEARFAGQPWQLMQLNGSDWSGGVTYPAASVADGDMFTLEVRATNVVGLTDEESQVVSIDLTPPAAFDATLSYDNNGTAVPVSQNETITAVSNPTLTVNWTSSSDPSGLGDYTVNWFNIEADGTQTALLSETTAGTTSSYSGSEGQRLFVEVTVADGGGNIQTAVAGPVYLDDSLTPAYIDMAEFGRNDQPYRNWTADSCNVLGLDSRRSDRVGDLFPISEQNFYATWDASGLRLAWQGADWNVAGDLFIYLDTGSGGSDQLHNPYPATANDTLILLPPTMNANYVIWVQDDSTATLLSWNGSAWVDSGQPFTFVHENGLVEPQTDLLLPFSSIGSPTTLSMVAVASEADALRLWASQPSSNSLNSALVVNGAENQLAHLFSLTQAYDFSNLGSGVCPSSGNNQPIISASATADADVIAYGQLSDGLFFVMPETLAGLRDWSGAETAVCTTTPNAPLCDRTLINNPTPAALDFDARSRLGGIVNLNSDAVGPGQTVEVVVNVVNNGDASISTLNADLTVSGPLSLVGSSSVALPTIAAGETASFTLQVQADNSPSDLWGSLDVVLYDSATGSVNEPLEWLFVDIEIDTGAPSLVLLDASQATFNTATSQRLFGTYVDQSPLTTITFGNNQSCSNDSPVYGIWSCETTGPTASPTAGLTGTDSFGAQSSSATSPSIANIQDDTAPTLTLGLESQAYFDDDLINALETKLIGTVSDDLSAATVEVCELVDGQEVCQQATVQPSQSSANRYSYVDQVAGTTIPTCGSPLVRSFNVSDSFTMADLDVGLNLAHPFRNDVLVTLTSPQGTAVEVVAGGTGAANYALLLDDTATEALSTDYGDHDSNLLFGNARRPANEMITAFSGEDPQGTWTLAVCDQFAAEDSGTYFASTLFFAARDAVAAANDEWHIDWLLPENVELADQTVRIYAVDEAGNRSAAVEYTYTLDTRGPEVTFNTFFDGQATDGSGIAFMTIKYHGPNGETVDDDITLDLPNWSYPAGFDFPQDALYAIYVEATDNAGNTSTINVYDYFAGNNPPVAVVDSYTTDEDTFIFVEAAQGVLANDSDPDGNQLTAQLVAAPAKGTLELNGDGSFSFDPSGAFDDLDVGQFEDVTFSYQASDSMALSNVALVTIRVEGVNDPPAAEPDVAVTDEDTAVSIDVLANDSDPENHPLSIQIINPQAEVITTTVDLITGTLGLVTHTVGLDELTYDPNMEFETLSTGDYANVLFTYEVQDTAGITATTGVSLTITGVNDPPVFLNNLLVQALQYSDEIQPTTIEVYDVDADGLNITQTDLPAGISMSMTDCSGDIRRPITCAVTISGTIQEPAGTYTATVSASDGEITTTQLAIFTVAPEEAVATLDAANRVAVPVTVPGSNMSEPFSLLATIEELEPDAAAYGAVAGDINLAQASVTLLPVDASSPITVACTPELVAPVTGYADVLNVSCDFADVPVNAYDVRLSVAGGYYDSLGDDYVLTVYDPTGGTATGAHAAALESCLVSDDKEINLHSFNTTDCNLVANGVSEIGNNGFVGGDVTSGNKVELKQNVVIAGNAISGGVVDLHNNVVISGTISENATVYEPVLPLLDNVVPGTEDVTIAQNTTLDLPAGDYADLDVGGGAVLNLSSGVYTFASIDVQNNATINIDLANGPVLVRVATDLVMGQGITMTSSGSVRDILFEVAGGKVKLDRTGTFLGTYVAPNAFIEVGDMTDVTGALYGNRILLKQSSSINGLPAVKLYFDLYIRPLFLSQPPVLTMYPDGSFSWMYDPVGCTTNLYRSELPYSDTDYEFQTTLPNDGYDSSSSLTSVAINYFYYVRMECPHGNDESNKVGEFTFAIVPGN
ncbi:MAG: LamG-like jellyroll fold domain-containing protein [Chloroflexota bacterium]